MMSLDSTQVAKVATLSRLKLQAEQLVLVQEQLNDILRLVDSLCQQDTQGVEPLFHPLALIQTVSLRLREDLVTQAEQRDLNMQNAPSAQAGLFLVPRVID